MCPQLKRMPQIKKFAPKIKIKDFPPLKKLLPKLIKFAHKIEI